MFGEVLDYFPLKVKTEIIDFIKAKNIEDEIEEIRFRINKKISLKVGQDIVLINYILSSQEMQVIFENICEKSVYSYTKQIANGFITIKSGNRVGLTGSAVIENEKVINLNYISSLNFRIARQIKDVSVPFLKYIIDIQNNTIFNTIIGSPPGSGKTTILRDLTRKISDGIEEINFKPKICGLVDERGEIAAMYKGIPQNDIGKNTDVITNIEKSTGINMLLRSMSPQIIICDEIGTKEDVLAIQKATLSGTKGIFTAHCSSAQELLINNNLKPIFENKLINRIIILDPKNKGQIKEILKI